MVDQAEVEPDLAAGVHQGVGDEFGDDQQGHVDRVRGHAPGAQGAPGEAAGVPDRLRYPPHRPALPQRPYGQSVVAHQQQRHVVAAVGAGEQGVRDQAEVGGVGGGQFAGQPVHAGVEVEGG